jgi:hypothetical protein
MGEQTMAILEQFPERSIGRMTSIESDLLGQIDAAVQRGSTIYVPVNPDYEIENARAVRLMEGLSLVLGERKDNRAVVGKMLCFREPQFNQDRAEEYASAGASR